MLFDTSAWVEFFVKGEKGELVKSYIKSDDCQTCIVTLAEISNWAMRESQNGKELMKFIMLSSKILELNAEISYLAGELNFKRKKIIHNWGMIDSLILAIAMFYDLKILTKDNHFKDLENMEIL